MSEPKCPNDKTELQIITTDPDYVYWCPECGLLQYDGGWTNDENGHTILAPPVFDIPRNSSERI